MEEDATTVTEQRQLLSKQTMDNLVSAALAIDNLCGAPTASPEMLDASRAIHNVLVYLYSNGPLHRGCGPSHPSEAVSPVAVAG